MAKSRVQKTSKGQPKNLMQNFKQIKLNNYWLNQPLPSHNNRYDALSDESNEEEGVKTETLSYHHPYLWQEFKTSNHSKNY